LPLTGIQTADRPSRKVGYTEVSCDMIYDIFVNCNWVDTWWQ